MRRVWCGEWWWMESGMLASNEVRERTLSSSASQLPELICEVRRSPFPQDYYYEATGGVWRVMLVTRQGDSSRVVSRTLKRRIDTIKKTINNAFTSQPSQTTPWPRFSTCCNNSSPFSCISSIHSCATGQLSYVDFLAELRELFPAHFSSRLCKDSEGPFSFWVRFTFSLQDKTCPVYAVTCFVVHVCRRRETNM